MLSLLTAEETRMTSATEANVGKMLPEHAFQVMTQDPEEKDRYVSLMETHYLVSEAIVVMRMQGEDTQPIDFREFYDNGGTGMLMEAARLIAERFEAKYSDFDWNAEVDINEPSYWEAVETFVGQTDWLNIYNNNPAT